MRTMTSRPRGLLLGVALAALLACTGCGEKVITVKGKVLKGGQPLVVSEDTYVTLSFVPEGAAAAEGAASANSARFDQKTGTYTVALKPGKYRTMLVVVPSKAEGKAEGKKAGAAPAAKGPPGGGKTAPKVNAPRPVRSDKVYDLAKDQDLDIEVPG
jgi:hypothetical protein